ncbi:guanine deaminase [Sorangium cellulosum]|uniref:Guanine deaminase n=1 Tax=Sorangium cellulosum TaxID=56 RepID=A0A150QEK2_SORCE|nr:guanine deaminase [Sorangium cellulosum]KYF66427.1 guanine deaminase [Sorangium cellulosum]
MSARSHRSPRAYRGRLLTPAAAPAGGSAVRFLDDALLVVDEAGLIAQALPFAPGAFRGPVLDLRPAVLMPGFIDAHIHFPQTRIIGSASGALLDWLERSVFPEEARFRDDGYAALVAAEFTARLRASGTTTCVVFSSSCPGATDQLFRALLHAGLRGIAGLTLMDQNCPEALCVPRDEAIPAARDLVQRWHGEGHGLLEFAITPRFAPSCSRPLMEAAARLAQDHDLLVQTHVAETPAEAEATRREHPWARDYLDVYDRVGLLTGRTLLAHSIHLSSREWDRIAETGSSVVHCPDSNFFLGSGRMRLGDARARAVPVALGSDVGAGRSFDMRRSMSSAFDNAVCLGDRLTPADLFVVATQGTADAVGLGRVIGSLDAGKEADFIAVRFPEHVLAESEVLNHLVFASETAVVQRAFVRGKPIYP